MSALRLEVEAHIVTASATAVQNLTKCVQLAGVKIDELVVNGLASAEAVLTETEKELGVAVADIGAGTIDLTLFADGSPFHTAVLPVGGNNVTNDVAIGVKTTLQVAEELKVRHGTCDLRDLDRRGDQRLGPGRGGRPHGQPRGAVPDHRGPDARDVRAAARRDGPQRPRDAAGRDHPHRRRGAARRAPPSSAARSSRCRSGSAGPTGHQRPRRHDPGPVVLDRGRAAPVGRDPDRAWATRCTTSRRPAAAASAASASAIRSIFP